MVSETSDFLDTFYEKENPVQNNYNSDQIIRKSPKAKYRTHPKTDHFVNIY